MCQIKLAACLSVAQCRSVQIVCRIVEQSATRHYRMWHSTTVSSWTQNILVPTVIPIYCVL